MSEDKKLRLKIVDADEVKEFEMTLEGLEEFINYIVHEILICAKQDDPEIIDKFYSIMRGRMVKIYFDRFSNMLSATAPEEMMQTMAEQGGEIYHLAKKEVLKGEK